MRGSLLTSYFPTPSYLSRLFSGIPPHKLVASSWVRAAESLEMLANPWPRQGRQPQNRSAPEQAGGGQVAESGPSSAECPGQG